jgi:hypothetical protein
MSTSNHDPAEASPRTRRLLAAALMIVATTTAAATHPGAVAFPASTHRPASRPVPMLHPVDYVGPQQQTPQLDAAQWDNAHRIVGAVAQRHMPAYAGVVSVATALQESKLQNITVAVDYDSLGLFQQRPSCGWGTPAQLTDPAYATNAFLNAMIAAVPNYLRTPLWQVAQATQQSAFPTAYAQWQKPAEIIVRRILDEPRGR